MAKRAGIITIQLEAGTAKFVADMDAAKAKVTQFGVAARTSGQHGVTGVQATSAALRAMEGTWTNNLRASERFVANVLHLGPMLQAAFPVIGAVAFLGIIGELAGKVSSFFSQMNQAPERIGGSFAKLNESLHLSNTEQALANVRLENTIASLQGRPPNHLKEALLEAREAAEKLHISLLKDLDDMEKLLKEEAGSGFKRFFSSLFGDEGPSAAKSLREKLTGPTGFGGFYGSIKGITDPAQLKAAYQQVIREIEQMEADAFENVTVHTLKGDVTRRQIQPAVGELFEGTLQDLRSQMEHIGGTQTEIGLIGKKGAAEQAKPGLDELKRLREQLRQATAAQSTELAKINIEEQNEIQHLAEIRQLNDSTLPLVRQVYDAKRLAEYNKLLKEQEKTTQELSIRWEHLVIEAGKLSEEFGGNTSHFTEMKERIEAGKKTLEEHARAVTKLAEEYNKLTSQVDAEGLRHRIAMIGANGNPNDPLRTLRQQQAVEAADVEKRYQERLAIANSDLERANLLREKNLELQKLQNQYEEHAAELRQRGIRDFFIEMQGRAQSAGNIVYQTMHSALDRVSDEFSKLFTGQKTSFGKMFQELGQSMVRDSVKSALQRGLGALGKKLGIDIGAGKPDGTSRDKALWVRNADHMAADGLAPKEKNVIGMDTGKPDGTQANPFYVVCEAARSGTPAPNGGAGGLLQTIGGLITLGAGIAGGIGGGGGDNGTDVSSTVTYPTDGGGKANGGDVSPGQAYLVGERGPEPFFPGVHGTVMSNAVAHRVFGGAGNQFSYTIDARGADLGAANRTARAIEAAHDSAVRHAVRASAERQQRVPQRTDSRKSA